MATARSQSIVSDVSRINLIARRKKLNMACTLQEIKQFATPTQPPCKEATPSEIE